MTDMCEPWQEPCPAEMCCYAKGHGGNHGVLGHPITDPARIAEIEATRQRAVIEALTLGLCASPSVAMDQVCLEPHGHTGSHRSKDWKWGVGA